MDKQTTNVGGDEQAERIRENVQDWRENPQNYSWNDLEMMFEDRDPIEFL